MRVLVTSSPFLALQCVQSICHAPHRLRIVQLCPKKGVWNFQALEIPAFIGLGEFQTPFFGQSLGVPRSLLLDTPFLQPRLIPITIRKFLRRGRLGSAAFQYKEFPMAATATAPQKRM